MLAPASLVLMTMLLSAPPAHAGHWLFSVGGKDANGKATTTFTPIVTGNTSPALPNPAWTPPPDANGSLTVTFPNITASDKETTSNPTCTCTVTATITLAATWTHDTGQNDTNDPAPANVWLVETSNAAWLGDTTGAQQGGGGDAVGGSQGGVQPDGASPFTCSGNANDGLKGDVYAPLPIGGPYISGNMTTAAAQGPAPPAPPGWSTQAVTKGAFTLTRSLSANGTASFATPCSVSMTCSLGSYTIKIHPQPYNMRLTPNGNNPPVNVDNFNGIVSVHYSISSTDGTPSNMTSVTAYETLDWSGNPAPPGLYSGGFYFPPYPPVQLKPNGQPYAYTTPNTVAFPYLLQGYVVDEFGPPNYGFVTPYPSPSTTWSATQNYLFDDSMTGETKILIPGPDNKSPYTLTRNVSPTNAAGTTGIYSINAHSYTALKSLP